MNIFLSYKWEDREYMDGLAGALRNLNNGVQHFPVHERRNYIGKPENDWKSYIKDLMEDSDIVICLIGQNTHNASGVKYEIEVAQSWDLDIIPVRIPTTNGGLPPLLRNLEIIDYNVRLINEVISRRFNR